MSIGVKAIGCTLGAFCILTASTTALVAGDRPNCVGRESPHQVHKAFLIAAEKNDWKTAYSLIEQGARATFFEELIAGLILAWSMDRNQSRVADFQRLMQSNGFKFDSIGRLKGAEVADWPRLMQDVAPFMKRWYDHAFHRNDSVLKDVQISGSRATAKVLTKGGATKQAIFVKGQSGWCIVSSR